MTQNRIGVVLNPSKFRDPEDFRALVRRAVDTLGVDKEPRFYETTIEDSGFGQAKEAVADECGLVIAAGGDGTVRKVAAGLVGSEVPMGIIPMGTGNLFARNIDLPINDPTAALTTAVRGSSTHIDLGWLGHGTSAAGAAAADHEPFLVIAGFGFDAVVMEKTDSRLKKWLGWLAYVVAGAQHLIGRGQAMDIQLDGRHARPVRARTVMIGNVGRLPGGFTIMPEADASNGSLEILALDWKGAAGFGQIAAEMVAPGARSLARISNKRTFQARQMSVGTDRTLPVQVDGDYLGKATHLHAEVQARALKIRTPKNVEV